MCVSWIKFFLLLMSLQSAMALAGVREDLQRARQLIQKSKLKSAHKQLVSIIRKYPENRAAYALLGRIFYQNGDLRQAAKYFKRASVEQLDGAAAFEYGLAMFTIGDYRAATKGLQRATIQKDIASFYLGVSYFKLKEYHNAERALRRARKIPEALQSTRRRLMVETDRRRRSDSVQNFRPYYFPMAQVPTYAPPAPGLAPGLPPGAPEEALSDDANEATPTKPKEPPKPQKGLVFDISARAEYLSETTESSNHGASNKTATKQGPTTGSTIAGRYLFDPNRQGQQNEMATVLTIDYRSLQTSTKEVTYTINDAVSSDVLQNSADTQVADRGLSWEAKPHMSFVVTSSAEIEAGGKYGEDLPEMKQDQKTTYLGPYGILTFGLFDFNVKASGQMFNHNKIDAKTGEGVSTNDQSFAGQLSGGDLPWGLSMSLGADYKTTSAVEYGSLDGFVSKLSVTGSLTKDWDGFSLALGGQYASNTAPAEVPASGIVASNKFTASATKTFKFGLSINGFGEYWMIDQFTRPGLCPTDASGSITTCGENTSVAVAAGNRQVFGAAVSLTPFEWAYARATIDFRETALTVSDATLAEDFRSKVGNSQSSTKFIVGLQYSF